MQPSEATSFPRSARALEPIRRRTILLAEIARAENSVRQAARIKYAHRSAIQHHASPRYGGGGGTQNPIGSLCLGERGHARRRSRAQGSETPPSSAGCVRKWFQATLSIWRTRRRRRLRRNSSAASRPAEPPRRRNRRGVWVLCRAPTGQPSPLYRGARRRTHGGWIHQPDCRLLLRG